MYRFRARISLRRLRVALRAGIHRARAFCQTPRRRNGGTARYSRDCEKTHIRTYAEFPTAAASRPMSLRSFVRTAPARWREPTTAGTKTYDIIAGKVYLYNKRCDGLAATESKRETGFLWFLCIIIFFFLGRVVDPSSLGSVSSVRFARAECGNKNDIVCARPKKKKPYERTKNVWWGEGGGRTPLSAAPTVCASGAECVERARVYFILCARLARGCFFSSTTVACAFDYYYRYNIL